MQDCNLVESLLSSGAGVQKTEGRVHLQYLPVKNSLIALPVIFLLSRTVRPVR